MVTMYYEQDCDLKLLQGKTVAIIGYGGQGHAHALNLKDSGVDVVVGMRLTSPKCDLAREAGLRVMSIDNAVRCANLIMMLIPDDRAADTYNSWVAPNMQDGAMLMFAHGFNIHYGQIVPPKNCDVALVVPKSPGPIVREQYLAGKGVPALMALHQDYTGKAKEIALAYAAAIGSARVGVLETTFREETETDLFGEQTALCGGVSELLTASFDTLMEAGYSPEVAYFEVIHELKRIVDLITSRGFAGMREAVSDTAEFGSYRIGRRIITDETRAEMKKVLREVQDGSFASEWIQENKAGGRAHFYSARRMAAEHPVEEVAERLRGMMSWLEDQDD